MYKIRRFFKKIKTVIEFLPVIWEDEDWDYEYLLKLVEFKLVRMRKYFINSHIIVEEENDRIIKDITETLRHVEFYREPKKLYELKYGALPFNYDFKTVPTEDGGAYRMVEVNEETGKPLNAKERKQLTDYLIETMNLENEEWKNIFKTIAEKGTAWWD